MLRVLPLTALASLLLSACAPATLVTLLPQDDGRGSAVEVTTAQGKQLVSKPYQVAEISNDGALKLAETTAAEVQKEYPQLLALQPEAPDSFVLEFEPGTSELTGESQARLADVIQNAQGRAGGEIVVIGHTDRQGSLEANDTLSLQRAQAVRDLLIEQGFKAELIEAVGRGEREPLVATEDEVVEPRNRRAEVVVR
jgi:outer membrane protein OmpA-like peptidoglycan-associated protein